MSAVPGDTPRDRIAAAARRHGEHAVVDACVALLTGAEVADEFVLALGGLHARRFLEGCEAAYWGRIWGVRGLLYVWDARATSVVVAAMRDESWRVREMCAKVVARRRVDDAASAVEGLCGDAVARVRSAAERALRSLAREDRATRSRSAPAGAQVLARGGVDVEL